MSKLKNVLSIAVAIVEDDVLAREILAGWIRDADGFRLAGEYDDAETAIARLPLEKPSVVLFDINLPGMNGIECVRQLKPRLPDTQFVMVTVYEDANHIFNALSAGASGYLLKQMRRNELLDALKDVHAGGSPMSSQIARKVVQNFYRSETQTAGGETVELSGREREVPGTACARLSLQGNRRDAQNQRADREHLHPPHLRKTARPLARPGRRQIRAPADGGDALTQHPFGRYNHRHDPEN